MNRDGAAKEIIPIINPIVKILAVEGKSKQVSGGASVCTPSNGKLAEINKITLCSLKMEQVNLYHTTTFLSLVD